MFIQNLKLTSFRNYDNEFFEFHTDINVFAGMNGVGKTNVLEAIYYLCFGKSYFAAGDRFVAKLESDFFRVSGKFYDDVEKEVVVKCKTGSKKDIEVFGKKIEKISDHIGHFLCVMIAPDDISKLMESSEERRSFINNTIVQSDKKYLEHLLQYTHLLKQRNALLKTSMETKSFDYNLLEAITNGMLHPAQYIFEKRREQILKITPLFNDFYTGICGGKEYCSISYESKLEKQDIKSIMTENIEKDRILGRTSQGVHKDDLNFLINEEHLKNYASQGQLKSFIIALKLAQYKIIEQYTGKKPIILLDDIFDKLDASRVSQLMNVLKENHFGQIFITDTQEFRIKNALDDNLYKYRIFIIDRGKTLKII